MNIPGDRATAARATAAPARKTAAPVASPSPKPKDLYDLDDQVGPPPAPRGRPCPGCGQLLPSREATLCIQCGYDLNTGKKRSVEVIKPKKSKKQKSSGLSHFFAQRLTSGKFLGGVASLIGGAVWLFLGLKIGRIFFYPIFLIIAGIFGIISGLISGDE